MNIHDQIQTQEHILLAPAAAKSSDARREREEAPCPFRSQFQRDRDRILHSKSFRRLKHKTQVYITPGDHYRTRMTHSLEVAQISRTIARALRLNEDLTEAIALGHDVGHTPFGHCGEFALRHILGTYEHREQSLRTVKYLEKEGAGLNLTLPVMDGILHHSGQTLPFTLEGAIIRYGDRIAYLCHDYDDSLRAGLLKSSDLPEEVRTIFGTHPSSMITAMVSDIITQSQGKDGIHISPAVNAAMDLFRNFMFEKIYRSPQLEPDRERAMHVIEKLYEYYLTHPDRLPQEFRLRHQRWGLPTTVVDYIAGLTDLYATELFKSIFIPHASIRLP